LASREGIATKKAWHTNRKREQKEKTADSKGENPLEL